VFQKLERENNQNPEMRERNLGCIYWGKMRLEKYLVAWGVKQAIQEIDTEARMGAICLEVGEVASNAGN